MTAENGTAKAPDRARIGEIHGALNDLAPYEPAGQVTATGLALWPAMQAQTLYARETTPHVGLDLRDVAALNASVAAASALLALHEADPGRAGVTADRIRDVWESAEGIGDWLAANLGPNAARITELAAELAALEGPGGQDARDAEVLRDALGRILGMAAIALGRTHRPEPDLDAVAAALTARGLLDAGPGQCGDEGEAS